MSVVYSSSYETQIKELRELLGVDSFQWSVILDAAIEHIDADVHPRNANIPDGFTREGRDRLWSNISDAFGRSSYD